MACWVARRQRSEFREKKGPLRSNAAAQGDPAEPRAQSSIGPMTNPPPDAA
jgi:hypothetical protein